MISIIAPADLRASGSGTIWAGSSWVDLDVDRVDITVNNEVKIYELIDAETKLDQYRSSSIQLVITGHIIAESELIGTGVFEKTKNLILAMRQWYIGLQATTMTSGDCGYPQIEWNDKIWNFLIEKVAIIDRAENNDVFMDYQMSCVLGHNESD